MSEFGGFGQNPSAYARNSAYTNFNYGIGGVSLGNPMMDIAASAFFPNVLPRPADNTQSMMAAMIMRQRSQRGFMEIQRQRMADNAMTRMVGGFNPRSFGVTGLQMLNGMTGGVDNGIVSRVMNTAIGGNPMAAQQKLYAGMTGLSLNASLGMMGRASLNSTDKAFKALEGGFYNEGVRTQSQADAVAKDMRSAGLAKLAEIGRSNPAVANSLQKEFEKAMTEAIKGNDVSQAFKKQFGPSGPIAKELAAAISLTASTSSGVGKKFYDGIDFKTTYGLSLQDIAGAYSETANQGLGLGRRGDTMATSMKRFIGKGEGGMDFLDAARIQFGGGSPSETVRILSDVIGNANINLFNQQDKALLSKTIRLLEANAMSLGVEKSVVNQLVLNTKEVLQSVNPLMGGVSAMGLVNRGGANAQAVLAGLAGSSTGSAFLRASGGTAGIVEQAIAAETAANTTYMSQSIMGMLGMAENSGNASARDMLVQAINNPNGMSTNGFQGLREKFAKSMGLSLGGLAIAEGQMHNVSAGTTFAQSNNLNVGAISSSVASNNFLTQAAYQISGDTGANVGDVYAELERNLQGTGGNAFEMRKALDNTARKFGGAAFLGNGDVLVNTANSLNAHTIYDKTFSKRSAAVQAQNERFAGMNSKLGGSLASLRNPLSYNLANALLTGDLSREGVGAIKRILEGDSKFAGLSNLISVLGSEGDAKTQDIVTAFAGSMQDGEIKTALGSMTPDAASAYDSAVANGANINSLVANDPNNAFVKYYKALAAKDPVLAKKLFGGGKLQQGGLFNSVRDIASTRVAEAEFLNSDQVKETLSSAGALSSSMIDASFASSPDTINKLKKYRNADGTLNLDALRKAGENEFSDGERAAISEGMSAYDSALQTVEENKNNYEREKASKDAQDKMLTMMESLTEALSGLSEGAGQLVETLNRVSVGAK